MVVWQGLDMSVTVTKKDTLNSNKLKFPACISQPELTGAYKLSFYQ